MGNNPWIKEVGKGQYEVTTGGGSVWLVTENFWEAVEMARSIEKFAAAINNMRSMIDPYLKKVKRK